MHVQSSGFDSLSWKTQNHGSFIPVWQYLSGPAWLLPGTAICKIFPRIKCWVSKSDHRSKCVVKLFIPMGFTKQSSQWAAENTAPTWKPIPALCAFRVRGPCLSLPRGPPSCWAALRAPAAAPPAAAGRTRPRGTASGPGSPELWPKLTAHVRAQRAAPPQAPAQPGAGGGSGVLGGPGVAQPSELFCSLVGVLHDLVLPVLIFLWATSIPKPGKRRVTTIALTEVTVVTKYLF